MAKVLIAGGAGFIGSHTCLALLEAGHQLVVFDNFSTSSPASLQRVREIAGQRAALRLQIIEGDVRRSGDLAQAFQALDRVDAVIHFAGLKAVAESVRQPLLYWEVNVGGSHNLLRAMAAHGCHTLVFSSSATVYGHPERIPIPESAPLRPINPYGHTKAAVERMLADLAASDAAASERQPAATTAPASAARSRWRIARLRYFNPVGAHPSGRIGENPVDPPANLFPCVCQVAVGQRPRLRVFGDDWPTPDGTGVRDYLHVMDLAEGHLAALETLIDEPPQLLTLNLGSGRGHSVLEVIRAFERVSGRPVPFEVVARRIGDAAESVADPTAAAHRLGWRARRQLAEMCADGWAWQRAHPRGYGSDD
jgi:UDP-glucose 4-epimerase